MTTGGPTPASTFITRTRERMNIMPARTFLVAALYAFMAASLACAGDWSPVTQWASGKRVRFFVGGDAGDSFASIVYKGALQA